MANRGETSSSDIHCVFVETSLGTRLAVLVHNHETISDFKDKLCKEHENCFPEVGEINISAFKIKRRGYSYHLSDSMNLSKAFEGLSKNWFIYVDAVRVRKRELLSIMAPDQVCSNHELLEKKKEIAIDSVLADGYTKNLTLEQGLKPEVAEKKTKKRNPENQLEGSSGRATEKKRKQTKSSKDHNNQSTVAATTISREFVNQINGVHVSQPISRKETLGKTPLEVIQKENEIGEKSVEHVGRDNIETDNLVSHQVNPLDANSQLTTSPVTERVKRRKTDRINQSSAADTTTSIEIVNQINRVPISRPISEIETLGNPPVEVILKEKEMGEKSVKDVGSDNIETDNLVSHLENPLDANSRLITNPVTERVKRRKKSSKDRINQSSAGDTTTSKEIVNQINRVPISRPISEIETLGNPPVEVIQKEKEMGEKSVKDVGRDNIETDNLVSHLAIPLDANSQLATSPVTERVKRRKKDRINQSSAADTTTAIEIVNQINRVPISCPISEIETLGNPPVEVILKEKGMGEKSVKDVGSDNIETDNLVSHLAIPLDANSQLATSHRMKRQKMKDHINQSSAAITTSREIVNEKNNLSEHVDRVVATSESFPISRNGSLDNRFEEARQKENEIGEKIDGDVGSRTDIPSAADNIQTENSMSHPENLLKANSGLTISLAIEKKNKQKKSSKDLTTGLATEKKNKQKKSSKIHINQYNERKKVIDHLDATSEYFPNSRGEKLADTLADAIRNENETGDLDIAGSKEATLTDTDKIQAVNSIQVADLTSTPDALAQESKTLDHVGKFADGNGTPEHEVAKDNVPKNADEAKSRKTNKKRKLEKAKIPAKEDTVVAPGAHNAEPTKVIDGGHDNIIRNVIDSLQERKETQENPDKTVEKSKKKSPSGSTDGSSDSSSDNDSDVTSMSRKQGNNLAGRTDKFSGSLQDILRSSRSYKKAKQRASQSQPDVYEDESRALDCVPDTKPTKLCCLF